MDKLNMESKDMGLDNIEKIGKILPNVIVETKDKPGKNEAILTANTPINKTLRPVIEDSTNWEVF